ncbi:MAG: hypothetical protein HGA45_22065 [Chloroflexales bacterium]|nr:hypothetical protein [Chloroflexales bacterium]
MDDVPLLLAHMQRLGLPTILDAHFPTHRNHQGLSLGFLCLVWLAHILSRADHRLNRVRPTDLTPTTLRVDGTTASGYWEVTADGLFQVGHSKDHRPDQPQLKVMLATLDPLGLPVALDVLPGQRSDGRLYLPSIVRVRTSLARSGLLYVGDSTLGAQGTRAHLHHILTSWELAASLAGCTGE